MIDVLPLYECPNCHHRAQQALLAKRRRLCLNCDQVFSTKPERPKKKKKTLDKKYGR